jgi:hypothetical protein
MHLFHFLRTEHALMALERRRLKVARINDLNDPFELFCPDMRDKRTRLGLRLLKETMSAKFGFLCFCRSWQNLLLWSHYADKHRGVALEIDVPDDEAMSVTYTESRVQWDTRKITSSGGFSQEHVDVIATTKSRHWEYEEEVRVVASIENDTPENGLYFCPVSIKGIVLGACSTLTRAQIRETLPKGYSVKVTQARLAFGRFDVIRRKDIPIATVHGQNELKLP